MGDKNSEYSSVVLQSLKMTIAHPRYSVLDYIFHCQCLPLSVPSAMLEYFANSA